MHGYKRRVEIEVRSRWGMRDKQRSIIARGLYGGVRPREGSVGGDVSKGRRQKATAASGIDKIFIFLWVS